MIRQIRPVVVMIAIFTLLTGIVFPLGFVAFGKLAFPFQAGGSLIERDGKIVGSAIIGQSFASDKYFHGRPSALSGTDPKDSSKTISTPYDASESGASNLAPTSKSLSDRVTGDMASAGAKIVPGDALTASASGLDPDISPATAAIQVARVAKARSLPVASVNTLVMQHTKDRLLGVLGEPRVTVLELNLALDAMAKPAATASLGK